ncbi:hypothetical protein MNBD_ALPHA03-1266 [hydrothermal vent metagenome]|uniref:Terminase large subunit gp17-like C-terminal domain-containing protein n=1 Tax=hydrothermal vent metagenome TaxID=652676 RepID=A0A3B1B1H4_9ZZZZ
MTKMSDKEREIRVRARDDFEYFSRKCLKIRTKAGTIEPLILNRSQTYLHEIIEKQYTETGKVRVIILKGRQQGCSTYAEGRLYWKTSHQKGVKAFILTHEEDATKNLFDMAQRYHENNNPLLKPHTGADNYKELVFDKLDSGYKVGTAKTKGRGRSSTIQYFHGSEVAFWPHAEEHAKGIMQAIPDGLGTEVMLESTANGLNNYFHQQWKKAESGETEYIPIFIPWFWQDEYRRAVDDRFTTTEEEDRLSEYYGLDVEQLSWRRNKIADLSVSGADGEASFKQEYPCNAAEAFQMTGKLGLITPQVAVRARNNTVNGNGPLVIGVDPSRGGDRFSVVKRQGRKMYDLQSWIGDEVDKLGKQVSICKKLLDTECPEAGKVPDMMFIDAGGGADLVDRLEELGYGDRVKAIAFGSSPLDDERYNNRRSEMWGEMNLWLRDENREAEIPDEDSLQADLCASLYRRDSDDRIVLLSKDKIKAELGYSPDEGDAGALTFSEPIQVKAVRRHQTANTGEQSWMGT